MNKVKRRAMSALLVAVLVLGGIGVYIVRYIEHGAEWATFAANSSVYTSGVLSTGTLTDRSGVVLATANGGSRSYADDAAVRTACYQAVGDYTGNIGTGALKAFSKQLSGYNPITGTYATDGHTVALTLDSSLCVTAYEALAGRKGAVLVSNYKTGEILCMASGPSIDPSSDGDVPDGAYINRCINGSFTPGSIFKLITSAAAIENIKDIDSRRFTCAGSVDVAGVTVKCTGVHGSQTFEDALANSCNCAFAQISLELGADTIESYAKKFGFLDSQSLSGIPTMAGSFTKGTSGSANLAWSGIGQYKGTHLPVLHAALRLGHRQRRQRRRAVAAARHTQRLDHEPAEHRDRQQAARHDELQRLGPLRHEPLPGPEPLRQDRHRRGGRRHVARLVHGLFARRCAPVRLRRAGGERRRRPDECGRCGQHRAAGGREQVI